MRRTLPLLLAIGLSLLLAAPASAALADRLVSDFADDGALDACNYSEGELGQVEDLIGNDTDAYEPDFRTAIDSMIERRAQGACNKKRQPSSGGGEDTSGATATGSPGSSGGSSGTSSGAGAGPTATGKAGKAGEAGQVPSPDQTPEPSPLVTDSIAAAARSGEEGGPPPFPLLAIGVLAALLALGGLVFGAARWTGWEPAWADRARHASAEAGWRASSTWAEFTDFVRFGR